MKYIIFTIFIASLFFIFTFCNKNVDKNINVVNEVTATISHGENNTKADTIKNVKTTSLATGFVEYAKTFIGTPYLYGSVNPEKGLDCSGFVNVVSHHFGIEVPRSSVEFTNLGTTIEMNNAEPGDLILFTGTDPHKHDVGHIGIITDNLDGQVEFIHSSSGKARGVTVSDLSDYYKTRFVKIIRILPAA
jgi:cell wall-associated NlpC family hydrolase